MPQHICNKCNPCFTYLCHLQRHMKKKYDCATDKYNRILTNVTPDSDP